MPRSIYKCFSCMTTFAAKGPYPTAAAGGRCPKCSTRITDYLNRINPPPPRMGLTISSEDWELRRNQPGRGGPLAVRRIWEQSGKSTRWRPPFAPSTFRIPTVLCHVTHISNVAAIAASGLLTSFAGQKGGLDATADTRNYALRDAALQCIFLATSTRPALSMKSDETLEKDLVALTIRVDKGFIQNWIRTTHAVILNDPFTESESVVSYADIPPDKLYFPKGEDLLYYNGTFEGALLSPISAWREPARITEVKLHKQQRLEKFKADSLRAQESLAEERARQDEESRLRASRVSAAAQQQQERLTADATSLAERFRSKMAEPEETSSDTDSGNEWD
jgi:DNA-directed RNA polymerase subunit RPC12/RpoP